MSGGRSARSPARLSSKVGDKDGDPSPRRRRQEAVPVKTLPTSDSKIDAKNSREISGRKGSEPGETTNPAAFPRSRSYLEHDGRGSTAQDGRRSGRRMTPERGKWRESRDEDRAARSTAGSHLNGKEKPGDRAGDRRVWHHDRLSEIDKNSEEPAKRRRQFREEKLPPESEHVGKAVPEPSKDSHALNTTKDAGSHRERDRVRRPLERNDYGRALRGAGSFTNGERVARTELMSRDRFNGGQYDSTYRGRQGYQSSGDRGEKWKHDLYDQTDRSPKNEDPVAKVEALLSL